MAGRGFPEGKREEEEDCDVRAALKSKEWVFDVSYAQAWIVDLCTSRLGLDDA